MNLPLPSMLHLASDPQGLTIAEYFEPLRQMKKSGVCRPRFAREATRYVEHWVSLISSLG